MEIVFLIGRILFAFMFVMSGINHLTKADHMVGYAQFKGVPSPKLAVQGSGVVLLLGGLSVILGVWADLGAIVLAALLVVMAVKMHNFWTIEDPQAKQADMIGFMKNISMAGGALFMFALMAIEGTEYGPAITESLFKLKY
ncbi:MAG: DoxX family protein [Ilumatobacteraceae bacterium]